MEEKKLFKLARAITDTVSVPVPPSEGGTVTYRITSLKRKLVNGKVVSTSTPSCTLGSAFVSWATWGGVTVGDGYLDVKINYSENTTGSSRSTTLTFTQNESNNKINLTVTQEPTIEYWEIRFNPITVNGVDANAFFAVTTNISGESGSMAEGDRYKNWIVNQDRYAINVYIFPMYPGNFDMLSWSCLDKNGNAFNPNYKIPDNNQYFTIKTTGLGSYTLKGLGSYTLKKDSTPFVSRGTLILSSKFNPTKKYPLDLNFYWGDLT
jgi:hypothetical protein